jgi:sugar phosphate isomerase/epimerase
MNTKEPLCRRTFAIKIANLSAAGLAGGLARALHAAQAPKTIATGPWQLGCYTRPWDQYDYRVALEGMAEAGFKYAGIMTANTKGWLILTVDSSLEEANAVGQEVKKRGLKALSLYAGEFPVAQSVPAGIEGLKKLINLCVAGSCPSLMLAGTAEEKLHQPYYQVIKECCDYAAAKGVGLSLKPHGGLNATGPQCRKAIALVGHKNFGLWYDPGNICYYSDGQLDPVDDAATVDGLVVGMSVKDYRPPKDVLVTPGDGKVDFAAVLARLKQGGFTRGPLLIECLARGPAQKITADAKKTRLFLEALTGQKDVGVSQ